MTFYNVKHQENATTLSYIYNGRLKGSRISSIKWC